MALLSQEIKTYHKRRDLSRASYSSQFATIYRGREPHLAPFSLPQTLPGKPLWSGALIPRPKKTVGEPATEVRRAGLGFGLPKETCNGSQPSLPPRESLSSNRHRSLMQGKGVVRTNLIQTELLAPWAWSSKGGSQLLEGAWPRVGRALGRRGKAGQPAPSAMQSAPRHALPQAALRAVQSVPRGAWTI